MRKLTTEAERNAYFLLLREKGEGGREGFGTPSAGQFTDNVLESLFQDSQVQF